MIAAGNGREDPGCAAVAHFPWAVMVDPGSDLSP